MQTRFQFYQKIGRRASYLPKRYQNAVHIKEDRKMATNEEGKIAKTLTKDLIATPYLLFRVRTEQKLVEVELLFLPRISKLRLGNLRDWQTKFQFENGSTSERLPKH